MSQSPLLPPDLINQLRLFAVLAEFRLQYNRGFSPSKHPGTSVPSVPMPISFSNLLGTFRSPLYWTDSEPELPPNEGIVVGEIIGHRCWRVVADRLWSTTLDYIWIPRQAMKGDVRRYGIHSFKDEALVASYSRCHTTTIVVGTIKMWGEVIYTERGYRAQYACVNSLDKIIHFSGTTIAGQDRIHGYFEEPVIREPTRNDDALLLKLRKIYGCTR
jgi:hypothetical protein